MNGDHDPFLRLVNALEPWISEVVIVGGWAHRLDRWHPRAQPLDYPPLMTLDADIAVPQSLSVQDQNVRERLMAAGFEEEFFGEDHPPATHYRLGSESSAFYAEFLTPLVGSALDRLQRRKATRTIAGINSQRLRYIEILLNHPWTAEFSYDGAITSIRVANPASFLAQKILIHAGRGREDRAKDILYIHDTLEVFGGGLAELRDLWLDTIAPQLHPRSISTVSRSPARLFGSINDDILRAVEISPERLASPEALRKACYSGLDQLFRAPRG